MSRPELPPLPPEVEAILASVIAPESVMRLVVRAIREALAAARRETLEANRADAERWRFMRQFYEVADINVAEPGGWHLPEMVRALMQRELPAARWPTAASGKPTVATVDEAVDDMLKLERYRESLRASPSQESGT